jgi:hypothetical protein
MTDSEFKVPINPNMKNLNVSEEQKVVIFCIPGKLFSNKFLLNWSELLLQCIMNGYRPILCQEFDKNIFINRNKCLGANLLSNNPNQKPFQGRVNYDYIVWIDPNIIFTFNDLIKLLKSPYDVTTGVYTFSGTNNITNIVQNFDYEFYKKNGTLNFFKYDDLMNIEKVDNRYFKTEFADMGWMCFKKGAAEKLEYPWFEPYTDKDVNLFTDTFAYCMKLKENDIDVMVDTNIKMSYVELLN